MALELEPDNVEPWWWKIYFDGAANSVGNGVGVVLVSPKGQQIPVLVKLNFGCAKYCHRIWSMHSRPANGPRVAYDLSIFRDSLLIISQIEGKWQAQDAKLILYQKCVSRFISKF